MTLTSRHEGFASFDALLSLVPVVMMLSCAMQLSELQSGYAGERVGRQQVFDKLVSAADYTVESGAVMRSGGLRRPGWLDESLLGDGYTERVRGMEGLSSLYIGTEEPGGHYRMCIYRLVVYGEGKEAGRLFVCGG